MQIALTGVTSFTGMWFALALAEAGHEVTALLRKRKESYEGLQKERLKKVASHIRFIEAGSFGTDTFFSAVNQLPHIDLFCHHAACVENYKSPNFPFLGAAEKNTYNLPRLLFLLKEKGCCAVCLTGSVFEQGEGAGTEPLCAVSPYGLSKTITAEIFHYFCQKEGCTLGKFVIPNPFGPYEEKRFCFSLMQSWQAGKKVVVKTPEYVRDNIPVQLLACCYRSFCEGLFLEKSVLKKNPSGYVLSQRAFSLLFQEKMKKRFAIPCELDFLEQKDWSEPLKRVNTEPAYFSDYGLEEESVWNEIAEYYQENAFLYR